MLVCEIATMFPTVMVMAARMAKMYWMGSHWIATPMTNSAMKILNSTANPIFLDAVARNPDTGADAPSYTSGAQEWNGTAAILKP